MSTEKGIEPRFGSETPTRFDLARWAYEKIEAVEGPARNGREVLARLADCLSAIEEASARRAERKDAETADDTQSLAKNEGMKWTKDEEQTLLARHRSGMPVKEIAQMAGRSNAAIRNRLRSLGAA